MLPIITQPALRAFKEKGETYNLATTDCAGYVALLNTIKDTPLGRSADKESGSREWHGGVSFTETIDKLAHGDLSGVAASDAYLAKLEDIAPVSRRWATVAAVAGGAPNIGAYLAGSPMAMRRRVRLATEAAPLTVLVDTSSSGGIHAASLAKRGVAVLTLVRLIATARPVSLYVVCGSQPRGRVSGVAVRLDTTPLDLARAAFMLGHPAAARHGMYTFGAYVARAGDTTHERGGISWPHHNVDAYRKNGIAFYAPIIPGLDPAQTLFLPPVFQSDDAITQPEAWLRKHLALYGGETLTAEAA